MAKRTGLAHAPTLLSLLLLVCFPIHVHCRIMDGKVNKKINLPHGLCVHKSGIDCAGASHCECCLTNNLCYVSMDQCMDWCKDTYSSSGASAASAHPPLPSHTS
ncbi:unnamed protein product [Triticum turgidum subsp. durum]|uniref:Uncharacterized protein n=1 Tax=Triticum turgidum subsp. durum TaxID=4567 RepID=A0A9R0XT97_TRITD|nr:unnamed protein product [Triticum turgidum subsp. durum]